MNLPMPGSGPGRTHRDFEPKSRFGPAGIGVMVVFHLVVGYALVTGLGKQAIEIIKKPLTATIVEEVKLPPPPPPPPPKPIVKQEVPKTQAPPPPAYVPPPDVTPAPTTERAPAITAVQSTEAVAPPPAAPPAPAVAPSPPLSSDIAVVCPKQVRPEMPDKAAADGTGGTVSAEARIKGGKVVDVRILSGPRVFHAAVRSAMFKYECQASGDAEVVAKQQFEFKVE